MLGPSPSAFAVAGARGWGGECGDSCTAGHQSLERERDSQPPAVSLDTLSTPCSCSVDRESQQKGRSGSDGTGKGTEKRSQQ